jgi:hypothetical protein
MGDLALEQLQDLAKQGSMSAMDDLLMIGSPKAARALAELAGSDDAATAEAAAWRVAATLTQEEVLAELIDDPVTFVSEDADRDYAWLTESGHFPPSPSVTRLVSRIARLIHLTSKNNLPDPLPKLHPAISAPLCGVTCQRLQDVRRQRIPRELVTAANRALGRDVFVWDAGKFRADYSKEATRLAPGGVLRAPRLGTTLELVASPPLAGTTRGELMIGMVSELAVSDAKAVAEGKVAEKIDAFLRAYVERTSCPAGTLAMLNATPVTIKLVLLHGLAADKAPSVEEWRAGHSRAFFGHRWVYVSARFLLVVLFGLSVCGWWDGVRGGQASVQAVVGTAIMLSVSYGMWRVVHVGRLGRGPWYARDVGLTTVFAPLRLLAELLELLRGRRPAPELLRSFLSLGFTPGLIFFSSVMLIRWLPLPVVVVVWAALVIGILARLLTIADGSREAPLRDVDMLVSAYRADEPDAGSVLRLIGYMKRSRLVEPPATAVDG